MIVRMSKVRIIGPRADLPQVLGTIQDLGVMHLAAPPTDPVIGTISLTPAQTRFCRHLQRIISDIDATDRWSLRIRTMLAARP